MGLRDPGKLHAWGGAYQDITVTGKPSLDTLHLALAYWCLQGSWLLAFNGRSIAVLVCSLSRDKEDKSERGADK